MNSFIENLQKSLTNICDQTFRIINPNRKPRKSNNWWNSELTTKRTEVNNARRRFQRCQTLDRNYLKITYQRIFIEYKEMINRFKTESWNIFIETNSRDNPWGIAYAISREKFNVEKFSELKDSNGILITDLKLIGETLVNTLFPEDNPEEDNSFQRDMKTSLQSVYNESDDHLFSELEVSEVIEDQNPAKGPGLDGFTADLIQKLHSMDKSFLTMVYNKCLKIGIFPNIWKTGCVKVLKKPNKTDYSTPKAYRPISLLSVFARILEKLLINRINYYLKSNNLLSENQYGFTPQKSTIDAIQSAVSFVKNGFKSKGFTLLVALDISGAFDNAYWPAILYTLRRFKCPKNLYYLTESYFKDRKAMLWFQNTQISKSLSKGCPQGSACGPGFWNLLIDSLLKLDLPSNAKIQSFADNTLLMIYSNSIEDLESKANQILQSIHQ